ncbi:MAG TPA: chorismate synthase [Dehalococcoidia bacterium]|nr:chorismate synthase [SAR202 cluster bacterium]HCL25074.1 chorismate synthase [Dehalococcoidia bacterium]|tara:strand:+ start:6509 stop:7690 length:1182 start_codon:yes stop_codon:yes gene_type:complete
MVRFFTAGESHGQGLVIIMEGVPAGLPISEDYIGGHLARRQKGYGRGGRMLIEQDRAKIISGVRHGHTLGSPIGMNLENKDWANWEEAMAVDPLVGPPQSPRTQRVTRIRPGHADLPGVMKYGFDDVRNVLERSSARETAGRVAAGAIAIKLLEEFGMRVRSHVISIGPVHAEPPEKIDWEAVEESPVRCADPDAALKMAAEIDAAKEAGDTVGGACEIIVENVPIGLGSHVSWDKKIDSLVAQALMSINAVKAVSIGPGWEVAEQRGSQVHDVILPVTDPDRPWQRNTNRLGGTEGGMTNGMPLVARFGIKPIPTMVTPLPSVDLDTGEEVLSHFERSDVCQAPPACVVGEAMVALTLADAFMEKFGGDSISETRYNLEGYIKTVGPRKIYQ